MRLRCSFSALSIASLISRTPGGDDLILLDWAPCAIKESVIFTSPWIYHAHYKIDLTVYGSVESDFYPLFVVELQKNQEKFEYSSTFLVKFFQTISLMLLTLRRYD